MNGTLTVKFRSHDATLLCKFLFTTIACASEQGPTQPLTSLQCGTLLQSLSNTKSFTKGRQLHAHIITSGTLLHNTYLSTKLAAWYASCGRMAQAQIIFDQILLKNSFLWNFMIRGYACNGLALRSLVLYGEMLTSRQKPDNFTYPFVLKACGALLLDEIGRKVHALVVISGLESDIYVGNSLLSMYSKFGDMATARMLFDNMPARDLTSWNTIIAGYVKNGNAGDAFAVFDHMRKAAIFGEGTTFLALLRGCGDLMNLKLGKAIHGYFLRNSDKLSNEFLMNSLIHMYCSCDSIAYARKLFDDLKAKDTVAWNSLISGHQRHQDAFETLELFSQMVRAGAIPDEVTIISVLGASNQISALLLGSSVHSYLIKKGFGVNTAVRIALIDMYSKCGSLPSARRAFDEMPEKNLASCTAMVTGYGVHGRGREAISIFHEMLAKNIIPDEGILTSVLSACSHSGLVEEGKSIFYKTIKEYKVEPAHTHYSCLVDLLGRAGNLDEAYEIINNMNIEANSDAWTALLSACRLHGNVKLAEISAQKLLEINPKKVSSYICLSNLYASERRWNDFEQVRELLKKKGLKKTPGCSFVELNKEIHQFFAGDRSHEQSESICAKLEDLNAQLRKAGYKPDTSSVLYDVEEEVKEKMLWNHSERLALAFALINTGPGSIIRITKNLRVCRDCHIVTKMISKLMNREIIMRDIRRFHHFKAGMCSCGDYW